MYTTISNRTQLVAYKLYFKELIKTDGKTPN